MGVLVSYQFTYVKVGLYLAISRCESGFRRMFAQHVTVYTSRDKTGHNNQLGRVENGLAEMITKLCALDM